MASAPFSGTVSADVAAPADSEVQTGSGSGDASPGTARSAPGSLDFDPAKFAPTDFDPREDDPSDTGEPGPEAAESRLVDPERMEFAPKPDEPDAGPIGIPEPGETLSYPLRAFARGLLADPNDFQVVMPQSGDLMLVFANGGRIRLEETGRIVDMIRDTARDAEAVFETLMRGVSEAFRDHVDTPPEAEADRAPPAPGASGEATEATGAEPAGSADGPAEGDDWPESVQLDLAAAPINLNGALVLAARLIGVPEGAKLSHGANMGGGVWDVDPSGLSVLQIAPAWGHDGAFDLKLELAVTHRNGNDGDHRDFTIVIVPVPVVYGEESPEAAALPFEVGLPSIADEPGLPAAMALDVTAAADTPVLLGGRDIETGEPVLSGSPPPGVDAAYLHFLLSGVPDGAILSSGYPCGDGTWVIAQEQLPGLMFLPPEGFAGRLDLIFTAVVLDPQGRILTRDSRFTVNVLEDPPGERGAAILREASPVKPYRERLPPGTLASAAGVPGRPIRLDLSALDEPDLEAVVISGIPPDARLRGALRDADGLWAVPREGRDAVSIVPAPDSGDFRIKVTSTDRNGDVLVDTITVNIMPVRAHVSVTPVPAREGGGIALSITAECGDAETELRGVVIGDLPAGTGISAGFYNPRTGNWVMSLAAAADVIVAPPEDCADDLAVTVRTVAIESRGSTVSDTRRVRLRRARTDDADAPAERVRPAPAPGPASAVPETVAPETVARATVARETAALDENTPGAADQFPQDRFLADKPHADQPLAEPEPEDLEIAPMPTAENRAAAAAPSEAAATPRAEAATGARDGSGPNHDSCVVSVRRPALANDAGTGFMTGGRADLTAFAGRNGHAAASFTDDEDAGELHLRPSPISRATVAQRATP